jgi:hypothetical protein
MRRGFALILVTWLAACGGGDEAPVTPGTPDAGGPTTNMIPLTEWVTSMTDTTNEEALPDSVDDKVGVVTDTDDPAAFDAFLVE